MKMPDAFFQYKQHFMKIKKVNLASHLTIISSAFPPPAILRYLNPARQRSIHRHANPHSSPRHRPHPEHRQHQKHRPHHQINNHIILRILDPGQIPATVGIAIIEHIQQPAIEPVPTRR